MMFSHLYEQAGLKHHRKSIEESSDDGFVKDLCESIHASLLRTTVCVCQVSSSKVEETSKKTKWSWKMFNPRKPFVSKVSTPVSDPEIGRSKSYLRRLESIWEDDEHDQIEASHFIQHFVGDERCLPFIENKKQQTEVKKWMQIEAGDCINKLISNQLFSLPEVRSYVPQSVPMSRSPEMTNAMSSSASSSSAASSSSGSSYSERSAASSRTSVSSSSSITDSCSPIILPQMPCRMPIGTSKYLAIPMSRKAASSPSKLLLILFPDDEAPSEVEMASIMLTYQLKTSFGNVDKPKSPSKQQLSHEEEEEIRPTRSKIDIPSEDMLKMMREIEEVQEASRTREKLNEYHLAAMLACQLDLNQITNLQNVQAERKPVLVIRNPFERAFGRAVIHAEAHQMWHQNGSFREVMV